MWRVPIMRMPPHVMISTACLRPIRAELGPVQVLINNAAVADFHPFLDVTDEALERICRINLMGPFILTREVIPDMLQAGWGRVSAVTIYSRWIVTRMGRNPQGVGEARPRPG